MTQHITHWIAGKPWTGASDRVGDVFDPATGSVIGSVDYADAATVAEAVRAAVQAGAGWRTTSVARRTQILFGFRELLAGRVFEVARLVSAEHGKVLADAEGEVRRGLEIVELACGIGQLTKGELSEEVSRGVDTYSIRQPLGVVAGITPFNFPAMVPLWMFPLAIACGNSFVLKPSEKDPSASLLLAELFAEAGLPDGVFNVVHGDATAVDALLVHPDVQAVSFVGSTPVARHVYETATGVGKRVQALGGAKNHLVVLPDADLDRAADACVSAGFGSAGERCMAISVVVAVDTAGDPLIERIVRRTSELRVGPATDPQADMGPLITRAHRDRVAGYLDAAVADGAVLAVDGRLHEIHGGDAGFWLGPSLLDRVTPAMSAYRDEIFGPVLSVVRVVDFDAALALVNASPFGNGAAIFTDDGRAARRFQHEVEAGMVGINVPIPVPVGPFSFAGWKASLFGDLGMYGPDGVRFYTRGKVITAHWPQPAAGAGAGVELGFPTSS
jgi:malonate-semialdehyde dehydrogenase (acetylating)/methylmalonate-semialdehyde dehydrogenase